MAESTLRRPAQRMVTLALLVVTSLLVTVTGRQARASTVDTATVDTATVDTATLDAVASDAIWIREGQLADGAIAWYVDRQRISPYLANYAAIGLAEAYRVTGDGTDAAAAWAWLRWYAGHEDATGFVTDYTVSGGVETSTGDMDSTDAYAGTYLLAVRAAYRATRSMSGLRHVAAGITGAVGAIEATQDADGLTWAKPAWHVKYLMDQSEAYAGLWAAVEVATVLGDTALAIRAAADAAAMQSGISGLWDAATASYDWAVDGAGTHVATDWTQLYPDAMEQQWAVGLGATDGSQDAALVARLATDHPLWADPTATDLVDGTPSAVGYWPLAGWAFLRVGDTASAATAAASIRAAALGTGRAWPFTTGAAGQLILLETADLDLVR